MAQKVAIATGTAHGMGESEARLFAREGVNVVVVDILDKDGEAVVASIRQSNAHAIFLKLDVTSNTNWADVIAKTVEAYGRLNILVNNARISDSAVGDHYDLTS